jgi:adenosylcobinamide amidohydrolase
MPDTRPSLCRSAGCEEPPFSVEVDAPWLLVGFRERQRMLSWAVTRPGFRIADRVAWLQVRNADLSVGVDPADVLAERMNRQGLRGAIGLMTSAPIERYHASTVVREGVLAACVVTLGLSNAERVGRRRPAVRNDGVTAAATSTINALCCVSVRLSAPAMVEAVSVATQARTVAVLAQAFEPEAGSGLVTGTGTDCIVIASPLGGPEQRHAGLHTAVGEALGAAVLEATGAAMEEWLQGTAAPSRAGRV